MKILSKLKYIPFLIVVFFILASCETLVNDLAEDKLPKSSSKLVVESFISPQSDSIKVTVTESSPLFGPVPVWNEINFIENANVQISNGQTSIEIPFNPNTKRYIISTQKFKIIAGETYFLTVSDGKRAVASQCTVPSKQAKFNYFEIYPQKNNGFNGTSFDSDSNMVVEAGWKDIAGQANYYSIRGYGEYIVNHGQFVPKTNRFLVVRSNQQSVLYRVKGSRNDLLLSNDINLDGKDLKAPKMKFYIEKNKQMSYLDKNGNPALYNTNPAYVKTHLELLNIDFNYYTYHKTLDNGNNDGNPFMEPTLTFTNIKGGLGCFGAYNITIKEF